MKNFFKSFLRNDSGAVTVDWVILTAGVVGLATVAYVSVEQNTYLLRDDVAANIAGEIGQ